MWFAEGVGKILAEPGSPGASATAEGHRARGAALGRGLVTAGLTACAVASTVTALATSQRGWLVAGAAIAAVAWYLRPERDPDRWLRGARGEMATAHLLSRLPRRFVVLHDRHLPGSRGNVDHIVIGPSGVWVVDSKVRQARLRVHHGRVWAGDYPIDVAPAARQAARAQDALGTPVTAIVAVHGVGLRRRGRKVDGVRVMPAERVARRIKRGRRLDSRTVVDLAAAADRLLPPAC